MNPTETTPDTRSRLLEAAGEAFAELGFQNTTVREICGRAGANIAAVHYHFGDKEALYEAVLEFTARQALAEFPIGGGVGADATPAEKLGAFVRNYLERLLNEGRPAWFGRVLAREMAEPTRALDRLAETFARPQFLRLREIVTELLGPAATEQSVRWCAFSVVGQCLFHKHARPMIARLVPEQGYNPADRAQIAAHITAFSLGAIAALRADIERTGGAQA
jgi:TetR/AcrR family transcriptional regulator, regulator of cefoperazone and chloramphenicol sensitivity